MIKRCLVTGGAGFIGSHIVDQLIELNADVIVIDNLSTGKIQNLNTKAKFIQLDLSTATQSELNNYFSNIDVVFHCAALPNVQYSIEFPVESSKANTDTTIKVLEAIRYNHINKIIYSSSCSVYGNASKIPTCESAVISPLSAYALQKYIGEEYCYLYNKIYNINYIVLRYFNVYGERMDDKGAYVGVLSHFLQAYKHNNPLNITNDGNQKRDFIYVKDVANANILAAISKVNNDIFNIGSGYNHSINTIAEWFGLPKKYGEKRIEPSETLSNINKAKSVLGWEPKQYLDHWIQTSLQRK